MNKYLTMAVLIFLLTACGSSSNNDTKIAENKKVEVDTISEKAMNIIAKSDCLTCHKVAEKLIGPAYKDVAMKYENTPANIDTLVSKVLYGGSGNWGSVPMAAHPALSKEDAETIVKYILSLRN